MKNLLNKEMTLVELSNELVELGYNDFFQEGTEKEAVENNSVSVTEDDENWENVELEIVEEKANIGDTIVKVTGVEEL